jgi:hypothetical protein
MRFFFRNEESLNNLQYIIIMKFVCLLIIVKKQIIAYMQQITRAKNDAFNIYENVILPHQL